MQNLGRQTAHIVETGTIYLGCNDRSLLLPLNKIFIRLVQGFVAPAKDSKAARPNWHKTNMGFCVSVLDNFRASVS